MLHISVVEAIVMCKDKLVDVTAEETILSPTSEHIGEEGISCSLKLTNIPQYSLIEMLANNLSMPFPCLCIANSVNKVVNSFNFLMMTVSSKSSCLCEKTKLPVYKYKKDSNSVILWFTSSVYTVKHYFKVSIRGKLS